MIRDHRLIYEAYAGKDQLYHVYDVMVSGMASEVTMVTDTYTVPAISIKDAQTKALNTFVKTAEEVDEFLRIVPAKSNDIGVVETGEESMLIVSKNKLTQDQIDDIVYGEDNEDEEGTDKANLPDVNTVMKKDEAYNILAKHLDSQDLAGVQDLPNGIGEAYQKGYDDLGWGKYENPYKEGTLGYYLYNWGQYDQETNG